MKTYLSIYFFLIPIFIISQSYDILFIGNSYTKRNNNNFPNDVPFHLSQIANDLGDTINYDYSTPGGASFYGHSTNSETLEKINDSNWDYVVLQEQSQKPSRPPEIVESIVYPYAEELINQILQNNSCTNTIFYMTWGRKDGDEEYCNSYPIVCTFEGMQSRLRESYLEMSEMFSSSISPVGISWKNSMELNNNIDLYIFDNSHPSIYGSYLSALTFYCSIFKKPVVGCSYFPNKISQSEATFLQEIAQSTVLDSLEVWNLSSSIFNYEIDGNIVSFNSNNSLSSNFYWDFGDGNESFDQNPSHNYSNSGTYQVSFNLINSTGCIIESVIQEIVIESQINIHEIQTINFKEKENYNFLGQKVNKNLKNMPIISKNGDKIIQLIKK